MTINNVIYYTGIIILFVIFFYFVYLFTAFIAKMNKNYTSGRNINIIEKVMIGSGIYLIIIEVNKINYLLSVSKEKVELIDKIENLNIDEKKVKSSNFDNVLLKKIKKTIKKGK